MMRIFLIAFKLVSPPINILKQFLLQPSICQIVCIVVAHIDIILPFQLPYLYL